MKLTAGLFRMPYRREDSQAEALFVRVDPPIQEPGERSPLHLTVALDRSSSMAGTRLTGAVRALQELGERLESGDRLAVVTFDRGWELVLPMTRMTEEGHQQLSKVLREVTTGYGTNLELALVQSASCLQGDFVRGARRRILLITDGYPSVGISKPEGFRRLGEELQKQGTVVTAFGLGEDFNQEILGACVRAGGGGYYYIHDSASLEAALAVEMGAANAVVAEDARLRIEVGSALSSVRLLHTYPTTADPEALSLFLGPLVSESPRLALFESERTPEPGEHDEVDIGSVKLSWKTADGPHEIRMPISEIGDEAGLDLRKEVALLAMLRAEGDLWRAYAADRDRARQYLDTASRWLDVLERESLSPESEIELHRTRLEDNRACIDRGLDWERAARVSHEVHQALSSTRSFSLSQLMKDRMN